MSKSCSLSSALGTDTGVEAIVTRGPFDDLAHDERVQSTATGGSEVIHLERKAQQEDLIATATLATKSFLFSKVLHKARDDDEKSLREIVGFRPSKMRQFT